MIGPANHMDKANRNSTWELVQILVGAIAIVSSCYLVLSFVFFFAWTSQVDIELILFASLEDILISGTLPTLFWAFVIGVFTLAFWTSKAVWPFENRLFATKSKFMESMLRLGDLALWLSAAIALVGFYFKLLQLHTGNQIAVEVSSWFFWGILALLVFFPATRLLATQPLQHVVPVVLLIFVMVGNYWYGTEVGQIVKEKRAQFRVDFQGDTQSIYVTLALPPLKQGIVFFESEICNRPHNTEAHFVPWSAIREFQSISDDGRDCS